MSSGTSMQRKIKHYRFMIQIKDLYLYIKKSKTPVSKKELVEEFTNIGPRSIERHIKSMVDVNIITRVKRGYFQVTDQNRPVKL